MDTGGFTCFSLLPKELRLQIWAETLQPRESRLITIETEVLNFNPRNAPRSLYLVGGDAPYTHFTMETPERPNSPYYTVQMHPRELRSPAAFEVCRESRQVALSSGYQSWKIDCHRRGTREILWNPELDTIFIRRQRWLSGFGICVFKALFPDQVDKVQNIAVETYLDEFTSPFEPTLLSHFVKFVGLKKVIFVLDEEYEQTENMRLMNARPWNKLDVNRKAENCFEDYKRFRLAIQPIQNLSDIEAWRLPGVRVAWSEEKIFDI